MSDAVSDAACRIARREVDDFTFARLNFDCVACNNAFNWSTKHIALKNATQHDPTITYHLYQTPWPLPPEKSSSSYDCGSLRRIGCKEMG